MGRRSKRIGVGGRGTDSGRKGGKRYSQVHLDRKWYPIHIFTVRLGESGTRKYLSFYLLTKRLHALIPGNFSTITVTYVFKRRVGYYLIQVFLPDIFVVALSWIVFWMDKEDMGNRMALGITTILTIMFLLGSLNGTMPRVSYPKALDWYLLVSFAFAFLSLVECMIVFVVWLSGNKRKVIKGYEERSYLAIEKSYGSFMVLPRGEQKAGKSSLIE